MAYLSNCTLRDVLGLAEGNGERALTYSECAEILEKMLLDKYPWIDPDNLYGTVRHLSSDKGDYCRRLVGLGDILK